MPHGLPEIDRQTPISSRRFCIVCGSHCSARVVGSRHLSTLEGSNCGGWPPPGARPDCDCAGGAGAPRMTSQSAVTLLGLHALCPVSSMLEMGLPPPNVYRLPVNG